MRGAVPEMKLAVFQCSWTVGSEHRIAQSNALDFGNQHNVIPLGLLKQD